MYNLFGVYIKLWKGESINEYRKDGYRKEGLRGADG